MNELKFPVYHATSSLFESSIREFGLGGKNPIMDLNAIELLKEIEVIADASLGQLDDWKYKLKYPISLITSQVIISGGNFQHGEVYLTPSIFTASNYSTNKYGSEVISNIFLVVDLLRQNKISINLDIINRYQDVFELEKMNCNPIIFKALNLPRNYLLGGEKGEAIDHQINKIEEAIIKYGIDKYESWVQQFNFRLYKPIPWNLLIK